MDILSLLSKEMEQEAQTTRKMLALVPDDKFDWKPHPKSMTMKELSTHVAEIPGWVNMAFTTSEMDFAAAPYEPTPITSRQEIVQLHEKSLEKGLAALKSGSEDDLLPTWTLRTGEQVHAVMTKYELIRHAFSQVTHHRAQLGVYLRLLDIPIPGSYGPSADEMM
jgi:uncharacterized damage-inducible protein DinB